MAMDAKTKAKIFAKIKTGGQTYINATKKLADAGIETTPENLLLIIDYFCPEDEKGLFAYHMCKALGIGVEAMED